MNLSAIVAMSENHVIGYHNQLPWHLPADLRHFKQITMGKPIIMGRKTYQSIGRPLPGRTNIIVTQDTAFAPDGCTVVHSIDAALQAAAEEPEVFIIGGATLYEQCLPRIQRLYMTCVHHTFVGDVYFPVFKRDEWDEVERADFAADAVNPYPYSFITLQRKSR